MQPTDHPAPAKRQPLSRLFCALYSSIVLYFVAPVITLTWDKETPTEKSQLSTGNYWDMNNRKDSSLDTLCDWSRPENIAIEYHDSKTIRRINYSDLKDTKRKIHAVLSANQTHGFIAISCNIKAYCVPALILGIQAQECAFINLPEIKEKEICSKLEIELVFSEHMIPDADLICELDLHGEMVKLLKFRSVKVCKDIKSKDKFAYAITTSGSTGEPKIVKVPHACIVPNILDLKKILLLSSADKIAQITTLTFDPSIVEIFLGLSSGGTLFVVSNEITNSPNELLNLIFEQKVTLLQTTPSLWQSRWSDNEIRNTIFSKKSYLRALLLGGEPFPKLETFRAIKHAENCTKIYNIYGITEVSCWASINEINFTNVDESDTAVDQNLGKPLSQTVFQVRNENDDIIRNGEGVLYIGSDSRICVIDDEESVRLEAPVFRKTGDLVTINGESLFYKERSDRTVKRFGNRVDLTELEATALKLNFVQNCIALWDEESHKLYLCVSAIRAEMIDDQSTNGLSAREELEKQLRSLPSFYQPDKITYFNKFRLTRNGKICRRTLMRFFQNTAEHPSEQDQGILDIDVVSQIFTRIWKSHLTLTEHYGFLDNGGTSVTAIQISNKLSVALNNEFPALIGLLLKNEPFNRCVEYVVKKIKFPLQENYIDHFAPSPNATRVKMNKKIKYDSTYSDKNSAPDTLLWQKCRGKITGEILNADSFRGSIKLKLNVAHTRDLKKCVDASPTVFKYSSGEIYTTVGSHAGVILTEQLRHPDSNTYVVNLPDRIEASVLTLNGFEGIVGCYDGYVYCLNLRTGQIIWRFKTGDAVKCTAVLSDDKKSIFVGSYDKYFYCISVKNGSELWKLKGSEGSISASPRTCPRTHSVVFGTLDGTCMLLNQTSGQIIWRNKFQDPIFSAPAVLENGDIIFCSVSGEMKCFDLETGRKTWKYKIDGNVFSHLVVRKDLAKNAEDLIIGCNNRNIYCLAVQSDSTTPILKYSVAFECPIFATPYCESDIIVVADTGGNINLLNALNGEVFNSLKLNGEVFSSPVIAGEFLVVGCRDNNMYILKIDE